MYIQDSFLEDSCYYCGKEVLVEFNQASQINFCRNCHNGKTTKNIYGPLSGLQEMFQYNFLHEKMFQIEENL